MGERTEDRMQGKGKRIVQEPGLEREYAQPLLMLFDELLTLDLGSGDCRVVFYTEGKYRLSVNRTVKQLQEFAWSSIHPEECRPFRSFFCTGYLENLLETGQPDQMVFRLRAGDEGYIWVQAVAVPAMDESRTVLCYVRDLSREEQDRYMQERIVDRYVYRECDFFLCLDADTGTYDILQKDDSRILGQLPLSGSYSREMEACVNRYVVPEDREMLLSKTVVGNVLEVLEREGEFEVSYGEKGPRGEYARKQLRYVYFDKQERKILLMRRDITAAYTEQCRQKKRLNEALLHARIDSLTGLYNRQAVGAKISTMLGESRVPPSVLLFIDLDNFKTVNDTLGHQYGDKVLRRVADCFQRVLRSCDIIGRVGGDEFVAYLSGVTSVEEAADCARRLCQAVSRITDPGMNGVGLSCSIGGAVCPKDGTDYNTLLLKADMAVYEAKRRGKNQFSFYETEGGFHSKIQ